MKRISAASHSPAIDKSKLLPGHATKVQRLAKAESERDAWRSAGRQENYLDPVTAMPGDSLDSRARQMAELCITFDGRIYRYRGYRYERFADAVNYARLDRAHGFVEPAAPGAGTMDIVQVPNTAECDLMRALDITFADGSFHWGEYRYDRLPDALAYARRGHAT
jgi:hypothetical protein